MKIDILDDKLIIYLYSNIEDVNFKDEICIEKFLKKLFIKLYNYYDLKIEGCYDVDLFLDNYYGVVLVLRKEELEYYYYKEVDMKIRINYRNFLYLVDNCDFDKNKFNFIIYLHNIYLMPKKKLDDVELARLMEFSKIIYDGEDIINKGVKYS